MTEFLRYTLLTADSNNCNSLEGITGYTNLDICFLQATNRYYRFFSADTSTPDNVKIIAPGDITLPAPGRWIQQGIPGTLQPNPNHPANLTPCNDSAALCLRGQGVYSVGDTVATFTFDVAPILSALNVPSTGDFQVSARLQLVGVHNINGNTPTNITQLYPIILNVSNGALTTALWNTTFETAGVPPGYTATPGTAAADNLQITDIAVAGTQISVEWTAASDTFLATNSPGAEICGSTVSGDFT